MSKRSEEVYPRMKGSDMTTFSLNKKNELRREGYEQAERDLADAFQAEYAKELARADLALTWKDIRTICLLTIGAEVVQDNPDLADNVQEKLEQVFYEDVLRRFREMKNK